MKFFNRCFKISLIAIFFHGGMAWGFTVTMKPYIPATDPEPPFMALWLSCYDIANRQKLNCGYTVTLQENENTPGSGGHAHSGISIRPLGLLTKTETFEQGTIIEGTTQETTIINFYETPEVSGIAEVEIVYTPPPGFVCFEPRDCTYKRTMIVKIPSSFLEPQLEILPGDGENHTVLRDGITSHPEGTYGTSKTTNKLKEVAAEYFKTTGNKLSINDLSLPWGGMFDIFDDWNTPHKEHRTGTDADINREDEGGLTVNCKKELRIIVETVAGDQPRPWLRCEPSDDGLGDRRHIDFD